MEGKDGRVRWYGHGHERKQTGARMVEGLDCWFGWFAVVVGGVWLPCVVVSREGVG